MQVLFAIIRIKCKDDHCDDMIEVEVNKCPLDDLEAEAKEIAEQKLGWAHGCFCPDHSQEDDDDRDLYDRDFDSGDFDPYTSRL